MIGLSNVVMDKTISVRIFLAVIAVICFATVGSAAPYAQAAGMLVSDYDMLTSSDGNWEVDEALQKVWEDFEQTRAKWKRGPDKNGRTDLGPYRIGTFYQDGIVLQYFDSSDDPRFARLKTRGAAEILPGLRVGMTRQDVMDYFGSVPNRNSARSMEYDGMEDEMGESDPSRIIFTMEGDRVKEIEFVESFYSEYANIAEAQYVYSDDDGATQPAGGTSNMTVLVAALLVIIAALSVMLVRARARAERPGQSVIQAEHKGDSGTETKHRVAFCPQCGAPIAPDSVFCSSCGNKVR